jgi:hypothetical protein
MLRQLLICWGADMQHALTRRTPAHLWIVGILALLWNGFGCFDYLMTNLRNPAYLSNMPAEQLAYADSLPAWMTGSWALGVWGGLLGSLLLLLRSRHAVLAFGVSAIAAIVGVGYQRFMTQMPASMTEGPMAFIPWLVVIIAALLFWYAMSLSRRGILR